MGLVSQSDQKESVDHRERNGLRLRRTVQLASMGRLVEVQQETTNKGDVIYALSQAVKNKTILEVELFCICQIAAEKECQRIQIDPNVRHGLLSTIPKSAAKESLFFIRSRKYSLVSKILKSPILGEKQTNRPIFWQALTMRLVVDIFGLPSYALTFCKVSGRGQIRKIVQYNTNVNLYFDLLIHWQGSIRLIPKLTPEQLPDCSTDLLSLRTH